jgi:hypothetical protein
MRNYWLKIALSALGIFAVGMLLVAGFRTTKHKITTTLESTDPIAIPVAFLPFRLDGAKLGALDQLVFLREVPNQVSAVKVVVNLADSVSPERFKDCALAIDNVDHLNNKSSFRCQRGDTAGMHLAPFGFVRFSNSEDSVPLLLPEAAVQDLHRTRFNLSDADFQVTDEADSIRDLLENRMDARSDSVDRLKDTADSLEDAAAEAPTAARRKLQHEADSVRTFMRSVVERMKEDEAELHKLDRGARADSMAQVGARLSDSIQEEVARQLKSAGVKVEVNAHPQAAAPPEAPTTKVTPKPSPKVPPAPSSSP